MKVSIGSLGRFHAFDLAQQLERLGYLERLYTGYPRFLVRELPPERLETYPWFYSPTMLLGRWGFHGVQNNVNRFVIKSFDRWMSSKQQFCDVFHCLSSFGFGTFQVVKKRFGALTICDRGSSHIQYQDEILAEEHLRWGTPYVPIDQRIIDRELREYEECDLIFVPSSFAFQSFVEKGVPESKIKIIPYGVDLTMFKPAQKEDEVFRVIYVGALSLQKGIQYLLEAICPTNAFGIELWLIGGCTREVRSFLKKYQGKYRYFGIIPRKDLYKYFSQGSVFVIPSIQEGLALVQAQAMACGLPVIATANTGANDLFSEGIEGFVVPIRDPIAIREKVLFLYENLQIRNQMATAALNRVRSWGGWNLYGQKVVNAYREGFSARLIG